MRSTINVAAGLFAATLLVIAGWLVTVPPTELGDDDGLWVCAAALVSLALAVQPPVGRRYPWLIAGLCILVAVSGFEALNYQAWHRQHRGLVDDGLSATVGGIEVETYGRGSSLKAPGMVTTAPPLRVLSSAERAGVRFSGQQWSHGRMEMNIGWDEDGAMEWGLSFDVPTLTIPRAKLPAGVRRDADAAGTAVTRYIKSGTTVIAGRSVRVVVPNCAIGEMVMEAVPPLDDGGAPVEFTVQPFIGTASDSCPASGKLMSVEAFVEKLKAEPEVTMTMTDAKGRMILTAVIPTARLAEALTVRQHLWDRVKRGDVGAPFSPFGYYLTSK
jgi:hypothetical protein